MTDPATLEVRARPAVSPRLRRTREMALVVAGQAGVAVASLAGLRLLTTLLDPAEFGRLALGLSIVALFQQVAFGPISTAAVRYGATASDEGDLPAFVGELDRMVVRAIGFSLAAGLAALATVLLLGLGHWVTLGAASLWYASAAAAFTVRLSIDASLRRRAWVSLMQVASEAGRFVLAGAAVLLLDRAVAPVAMLGFAVALTLAFLVQHRRAPQPGGAWGARSRWRPVIERFSRPLALTGILTWGQMTSDRWSLNALLSAAHVGAYAVVYQIAVAPFALLGSMALGVLGPIVFRIAGTGNDAASVSASHAHVKAAVAALLAATAVGTLVAWQWHEAIFALLVGPAFARYSALLPLGVVVGGLLAAGQVIATTVLSRGDTTVLVVPKAVTAVVGLVLNVGGAWQFGVIGVLWANVAYGLLFFAWMAREAAHPAGGPPGAAATS